MPTFYIRYLVLLIAIVMSCTEVTLGTDYWDTHLHQHTCNANCGYGHRMRTMDSSYANSATDFTSDQITSPADRDDAATHLFLSVLTADGIKRFSSGAVRSGKVEYGALTFEMNSTSIEVPTEFRMLLDGEGAHPETFEAGNDWQGRVPSNEYDNGQGWSRTVQWNCPPLGRHSIQFQVRLKDTLVTSEQLWIEIVAPLKPEVVAVGSSELGTSPTKSGKIVTVYQDTMVVRFAMPAAAEMIMHRPGLEDVKVQAVDECCFQFDLKDLSVGRHALKFSRVVDSGCSMTSEPSDPLWIQYEPTQALHSLRNENAIRRRAIVDEIRKISAASRPTLDATLMYDDVNSKFSTFDFDSEIAQTERASQSAFVAEPYMNLGPAGAGAPRASAPTAPPIAAPIAPPTSPPAAAPTPASNSQDGVQSAPRSSSIFVPEPKSSLVRKNDINLVAKLKLGQEEHLNVATVFAPKDIETSLLLRKTAQADADRLSKFEDDLAIAESVWQANKVVSHVIFDAPAYFTQKGYGTSGEEDARNGLVLLEGMELSTQASGHWELKIPYIKSASPAVLHLQIQFKTADGYWKPLTLQPVCFKAGRPCIDPSDCNCAHNGKPDSDQTVRCECPEGGQPMVTLNGFSPILRREVGVFTDVRRRGSTVFGHGYAALQDRRSF